MIPATTADIQAQIATLKEKRNLAIRRKWKETSKGIQKVQNDVINDYSRQIEVLEVQLIEADGLEFALNLIKPYDTEK